MITLRSPMAPYVQRELRAANRFEKQCEFEAAFRHLERAHVLSQNWTWQHVRVHWRMFLWGARRRDWREVAGQTFRILGAAAKTGLGLVPRGNTGGAKVSPFRAMPIADDLAAILAQQPKPSRLRYAAFVLLKFALWAMWGVMTAAFAPLPQDARTAIVDSHHVAVPLIGSGRPAIIKVEPSAALLEIPVAKSPGFI